MPQDPEGNPYAPLEPAPGDGGRVAAALPPGWAGPYPFDSRVGLSRAVVGLLIASGVLAIASALVWIVVRTHQAQVRAGSASGDVAGGWVVESADWISFVQAGLLLTSGICFALWFRRKHGNLQALGAGGLRFTWNWAALAFFVPIVNLFRPYQIGVEIWRASDPALSLEDPNGWRGPGSYGLVLQWWLTFIGARVLETLAWRLSPGGEVTRAGSDLIGLMVLSQVLLAVSAGITVQFVRELDRRQVVRFDRRSAVGAGGYVRVFSPMAPAELPGTTGLPGLAVPAGPHCPTCLAPYRPEDYRAGAEHIYCSRCRAEIPRSGSPD